MSLSPMYGPAYGQQPWHLFSLLIGTPILALGLLVWTLACARIAFHGRWTGWFLLLLPLVLVTADGLAIIATFMTVRRRIWMFGMNGMAFPITTWSAVGWSVIAAGQGLFLGLGGVGLWTLAPRAVDENESIG